MNNRRITGIIASLIIATTFGCTSALAGEVTGRIEFIQTGYGMTPEDVYVLVKMNSPTTNGASCAGDTRFAVNPTTNAGKVILALLTTARASGMSVYLVGSGSCMANTYETISWMRLLD